MSIVEDLSRIINAKNSLRTVIQSRGIQIGENARISDYAEILTSLPYIIKGSFTPEEDVYVFSLSGLDFTPESVLFWNNELATNLVAGGIFSGYLYKGELGAVMYSQNGSNMTFAKITPQSTMLKWDENGVNMTIPASSETTFKKGYTYNYVVIGGKSR